MQIPLHIRLWRIFALLLYSVSCLRDGYSMPQKFDSVRSLCDLSALRMTRERGNENLRPLVAGGGEIIQGVVQPYIRPKFD